MKAIDRLTELKVFLAIVYIVAYFFTLNDTFIIIAFILLAAQDIENNINKKW